MTSRLSLKDQSDMSQEQLAQLVQRLEKVTVRLESVRAGSTGSSSDEVKPFVKEFDNAISGTLSQFVETCQKIGGLVNDQAQLLKDAFAAQRDYLVLASKAKKPTNPAEAADLLGPTSEKLTAILDLKEKNRRSEYFNHLSALAEGVSALGWVTVDSTPAPFIKEMSDAGMFYVNRVLKEFKEKDPVHAEWSKSLITLWKELQAYVKQYHTTGVSWNPQGENVKTVSAAPSPPGAPVPPPPPPAACPPPPPPASQSSGADPVDATALFADINKGGDVTKGLKKVRDDQKTHKNPALRSGPAPFKAPTAPKTAPKPVASKPAPVAKPPLVELQGKKWIVEYLNNSHDTIISEVNNKQTVYIFKCVNSTIQVKGKVNSVILDSCKKTSVVIDDAISMVEFVNCQSVKAQVMGKVPTVSIEKTDGCQVYLSKESLDTSFISAKSSEMNVVIPTADGDYQEYAIAEQFKTYYNGKTLITEVNDIAA